MRRAPSSSVSLSGLRRQPPAEVAGSTPATGQREAVVVEVERVCTIRARRRRAPQRRGVAAVAGAGAGDQRLEARCDRQHAATPKFFVVLRH